MSLRLICSLIASLAWISTARGASLAELPADEVMARVKARAVEMARAGNTSQIRYLRSTLLEQLSAKGEVKESTKREYEVIQFSGVPFAKVVKVDGRALPDEEQRREQEKERKFRGDVGGHRSSKEAMRNPWLNEELLARFVFSSKGWTNMEGRAAYLVGFSPRQPAVPARSMADRLINRLAGTLAVDAEDFEVSWMSLNLSEKVTIGGGILGAMEKFDYQVQRKRLDEGGWVNLRSFAWVEFRKFFSTSRYRTSEEAAQFEWVPPSQRLSEPPDY